MMAAPSVYAAINAVSAELARIGIAKTHTNVVDDYKYRSIDDVLDRLAPLLAQHRLCILPRVLDREAIERRDEMERSLFHVTLRVAFSLTSVDDGSSHTIESYGEALDPSDKATAKAMSAAYKSAMVQTFCIPVAGVPDPDCSSPRVSSAINLGEPVQGWDQWAADIGDIVDCCETIEAVEIVTARNRDLLNAMRRERQKLYRNLGARIASRTDNLGKSSRTEKQGNRRKGPAKERADS